MSENTELHLGDVLRLMLKRKHVLFAAAILGASVAGLYTLVVPETYQATAILMLDDSRGYLPKIAKELADSDEVINAVKEAAGIGRRESIGDRFSSRITENALFLRVVDPKQDQAVTEVNVWARLVQETVVKRSQSILADTLSKLRDGIKATQAEWHDSQDRARKIASENSVPERLQDLTELEMLRALTTRELELERVVAETSKQNEGDRERARDELNQVIAQIKKTQSASSKAIENFYRLKELTLAAELAEKHTVEMQKKLDELELKANSLPAKIVNDPANNVGFYRKHEWPRNLAIGVIGGLVLGIFLIALLESLVSDSNTAHRLTKE